MDEHPNEIHGIEGGTDELDITSITVPYMARSLEEARTVALGRIVSGLPEKNRTFTAGAGGLYIVHVLYEGQPPIFGDQPTKFVIGLKTAYTEEPIEAHPKINEIVEKYNGQWDENGNVHFPPTYTPKTSARGAAKTATKEKKNPYCGVQKRKKLEISYTRTYASGRLPASLILNIGHVISTPPGFPSDVTLPSKSKWLIMPLEAPQRGNVFEITEEYQFLDEDTPEEEYDSAEGEIGLSSGGLNIGGL